MTSLRAFLELNEAMALRALLDQILAVEQVWGDEVARKRALAELQAVSYTHLTLPTNREV